MSGCCCVGAGVFRSLLSRVVLLGGSCPLWVMQCDGLSSSMRCSGHDGVCVMLSRLCSLDAEGLSGCSSCGFMVRVLSNRVGGLSVIGS